VPVPRRPPFLPGSWVRLHGDGYTLWETRDIGSGYPGGRRNVSGGIDALLLAVTNRSNLTMCTLFSERCGVFHIESSRFRVIWRPEQ
jgi:hypothetical protein